MSESNEHSVTPEASQNQLEYIRKPYTLEDVLFDQLAWLIAHSQAQNMQCPADCGDCKRLSAVTDLLLRPFEMPARSTSTPSVESEAA